MSQFSFKQLHKDKKTNARRGVIHAPHGDIQTPAFVPVGTQATVKSLTADDLRDLGVQLHFVNTYHMYLRPGVEVVKKAGGLHGFMGWDRPLITDSGGFQVFSLARSTFKGSTLQGDVKIDQSEQKPSLVKISEDGVEFRSHWDGSKHMFTPESSMQWQWELGADMHIAFDDCTAYPVTYEVAKASMERTHRWATRSLEAHKKLMREWADGGKPMQALYGSIQGSVFEDLRKESAAFISSLDTEGIAIGGVSVGESKKEMKQVLDWVMPVLPSEKPRHLLGVGEIDDIFTLVEAGVDTFDCVQPTRLARMGWLYTRDTKSTGSQKHILDITKSSLASDMTPPETGCGCYTCTHVSRAYLHHLFHVKELSAYRFATIHNLFFIHKLVSDIRTSIENDSFLELKTRWL
jgi:queuine tRNA-ribosyltransferase